MIVIRTNTYHYRKPTFYLPTEPQTSASYKAPNVHGNSLKPTADLLILLYWHLAT